MVQGRAVRLTLQPAACPVPDVGAQDRDYYLGHSVKALTGRWQKNRDVYWYTREKGQNDGLQDELRAVKEREEQLMMEVRAITSIIRTRCHRCRAQALPAGWIPLARYNSRCSCASHRRPEASLPQGGDRRA